MRFAKALTGAAAAATLVFASGAALLGPLDEDISREGTGPRRDALTEMETMPFPADFGDLTDWANVDGFDKEMIDGKPVLIVTWSSWYRGSHPALTIAEDLHDRYAKRGLVVIGVHHDRGFANAARVASAKKLSFPYAHDSSGAFRSTLDVDQDPDFYLIDRAGNLRYADVETGSVGAAVAKLVSESKEEAAGLRARLADAAAKAEEEMKKAKRVRNALRPGEILEVPFRKPLAGAYENVKWPDHTNDHGGATNNVQGKPLPKQLGNETVIANPYPKLDGRVIVLDFWATWCGPCRAIMPKLDSLQKKHRGDVVIVGISNESVQKVRTFSEANHYSFTKATDPRGTIARAVGVRGIPHTVIVSSDGVVRWQGNPHDPKFVPALEKVVAGDPGVKARRAAEEEHLRKVEEEKEENVE